MGPQSSYMWQQGHPPPPHSWGHGSPTTGGSIYTQRGGPSMTPDRPGYASAYTRAPPPPIQGPGGVHRGAKSSGPPPRQSGKSLDKPPKASSGPSDVPSHQPGYQGSYYPPPQAPYGSSSYPSSGPPPMHHPPTSYGNPPPPPALYGSSPPRPSQTRNRASPELMGANSPGPIFCQPAESPDLEGIFSRGVGPLDDDGNGSTGGGGNSKDKGRGSYKCGRVGVDVGNKNDVGKVWQIGISLFIVFLSYIRLIRFFPCAVRCAEKGSCMSVPAKTHSTTWRTAPGHAFGCDPGRDGRGT